MQDLLKDLNPDQHAAVTLPPEHALILAGAGSGKTRVLTTRIAWLLSTRQVSPAGVLAVTFTNKAAREMSARLSAMLPINPRAMWIGTFHGLCHRMLRAHHREANLAQTFQIIDSQDQLAAIKRLIRALNVDDEKFPPRNIQHFINSAKEEGLRSSQVEAHDDYARRCVELYEAYDAQCQREGVVDFAELLLRSFELMQRDQHLREHYQRRFAHILVDEFQDTNRLQYRWLKALAAGGASLFAVGDDDQSIYAFRGANVGNMAAFEREYQVTNLVKLEQNYRSHGNILAAANTLIRNNLNRLGKNLWTDFGEGEPVRVYEAVSDALEAQWAVEEIQALSREGMGRDKIAVLYRSNAQSRVIEHALFSAGLPYRVYGGLRFFERAEVKHALAYLRLIENGDDDGAFLRVVNFPARGIGARSVEALQDAARAAGSSLLGAVPLLQGAAASRMATFSALVSSLRAETADLTLAEAVEHLIERSGLVAHYRTEREGQERVENLRELVNAAAAFVADPGAVGAEVLVAGAPQDGATPAAAPGAEAAPVSPLAAFLAHASLEAGDHQASEGAEAVQLMTVHSAKGLEFDAVFITGLEEGLFPHENALAEDQGLEEERRLMYVAITRARKRLHLSFSQTRMLHGQTRYSLKSRFLDELPESSLKWLTPRTGARQRALREGWGGGWNGLGSRREPASGAGRGAGGAAGTDWSGGASWSEVVHQASRGDRAVAQRFDRGLAFRVGQSVAHARFGEGVIVDLEGSGSDARAQVNFAKAGVKWLALAVAKLEPVG